MRSAEYLKLQMSLGQVESRLASGQSLKTALSGLAPLKADILWVKRWIELKQQLHEGRGSVLSSIRTFRKWVENEWKVEELFQKKMRPPRMQIYVTSLLSFILGLISYFFLSPTENPAIGFYICALGLHILSLYCSQVFYRLATRKLWFRFWMHMQSQILGQLLCGHSLPQCINHLKISKKDFPKAFFDFLSSIQQQLPQQRLENILHFKNSNQDPYIALAIDQSQGLLKAYVEGSPLTPQLEAALEQNFFYLQNELERSADILSFSLLIPLFLFSFPGTFCCILAPVFSALEF